MELLYDPAIPLLSIYPDITFIQKDTCTCMSTAALFTIAKTWKQPKCPLKDEWIYNEILLSSTENCLDTYIATEQRVEKKCIHVNVTWSPCCTVENK